MKPFDLEKAMAGEPVVTRDGREVTQLHLFDAADTKQPLVGIIHGYHTQWDKNGMFYGGIDDRTHDSDLFMKSKTVVKWVNIYIHGYGDDKAYMHDSEYEADNAGNEGWKRLGNKAHRIEWEE